MTTTGKGHGRRKTENRGDGGLNRAFCNLHPFVIFFYYLMAALFLMLYQHPFFLLSAGPLLFFWNWIIDRGKTVRHWGRMLGGLMVLFLLLTPLFNRRGNVILFTVFHLPVTLESLLRGAMGALTLFDLLLLFFTLPRTLTGNKFLFLFSRPFPQWTFAALMAVRFVPLLARRLQTLAEVHRTTGIIQQSKRKTSLALMKVLLSWSLEEGLDTADSMAARGYGSGTRSRYIPYSFRLPDKVGLVILCLLSAGCFSGWYLGDGVLTLSPLLEPVLLFGREWLFFPFFAF